ETSSAVGPVVIAVTGEASTGAANTTASIALKIRRTSRVANESSDMRKRPFQCWAILRKQPQRGPNGWVVKLVGNSAEVSEDAGTRRGNGRRSGESVGRRSRRSRDRSRAQRGRCTRRPGSWPERQASSGARFEQ